MNRFASTGCSGMCPASRHERPRRNRPPITRRWSPTAHRYRRRLSVHASRSGMVSLPALKGHLQHVSLETRVYCSAGFCRAVNLVFDNEHFRFFCDHFRRPTIDTSHRPGHCVPSHSASPHTHRPDNVVRNECLSKATRSARLPFVFGE
ncbi:hypothetical protein BC2230_10189 [Burkholderia cepacia]